MTKDKNSIYTYICFEHIRTIWSNDIIHSNNTIKFMVNFYIVGRVFNFFNSVSPQQKFEATHPSITAPCYSSVLFANKGKDILSRCEAEKAMAPHSSTLAWKIPWTEEPGRLQSMGSRRVGQDWVPSLSLFTFMHWRRKEQPGRGSHRVGHNWSNLAAAAAAAAAARCDGRPSQKTRREEKPQAQFWLLF